MHPKTQSILARTLCACFQAGPSLSGTGSSGFAAGCESHLRQGEDLAAEPLASENPPAIKLLAADMLGAKNGAQEFPL